MTNDVSPAEPESEGSRGGRVQLVGRVIAAVVLLGVVTGAYYYFAHRDHGPAPREAAGPRGPMAVGVMTVERRDVPLTSEFLAQTEPSQTVPIRARVAGYIVDSSFEEGQPVEETQRVASAQLETQRALVEQATLDLGYATVASPISGVIGERQLDVGSYVGSGGGEPLAVVRKVDPMYVRFSVSERDLLRWQRLTEAGLVNDIPTSELTVTIILPDGRAFPDVGHIDYVDVAVDPSTGTAVVRATVPNPEGALLPGQFVNVEIGGVRRLDAIVVPQSAVLQTPGGASVYVVDDQGTAQMRPVTLGELVGSAWLVESGLDVDDRVLVLSAVFVPVAFLGGLTGQLYKQFAVTIAVSVAISGFVALTLSPALCAMLLKPRTGKKFILFRWFDKAFDSITNIYVRGVAVAARYAVVTVAIFGILCFALYRFQASVPSGFLPDEDQGYIIAAVIMPDGASLERTDAMVRQAEAFLLDQPGSRT